MKRLQAQRDGLERERSRGLQLAAVERERRESEVRQLTATVQTLSLRLSADQKSQQILGLSAELQAEKVAAFHLRQQLDDLRLAVDREKAQTASLRSSLAAAQSQLDGQQVLRTLADIPGVPALRLLEVFAEDFVKLRTEADRLRAAQDGLQEEARGLQQKLVQRERVISQLSRPAPAEDTPPPSSSDGPETGRKQRSASPAPPRPRSRYQQFIQRPRSASPTPRAFSAAARDGQQLHLPSSSTEPIRLAVEHETTPAALLQSLDLAVLKNKLAAQEAVIQSLEAELDGLRRATSGDGGADPARFFAEELFGDFRLVGRQELIAHEHTARQLEAAERRLEELRRDLEAARRLNVELEKKQLGHFLAALPAGSNNPSPAAHPSNPSPSEDGSSVSRELHLLEESLPFLSAGQPFPAAPATADEEAASKRLQAAEEEAERLRGLLQERTGQLKVLMETLEAVQLADPGLSLGDALPSAHGPGGPEADLSEQIRRMEASLLEAARSGRPASSPSSSNNGPAAASPWMAQALTRRIIELSTELLSALAQQAVERTKAERFEKAVGQQLREVAGFTVRCQRAEEEAARQRHAAEALMLERKETAAAYLEETHGLRREADALRERLEESEREADRLAFRLQEAEAQLTARDAADLREVLAQLHPPSPAARDHEEEEPRPHGAEDKAAAENQLNGLVAELLLFWKEQERGQAAGQLDSASSVAGSRLRPASHRTAKSLSRPEKEFLQKIADFVLAVNQRLLGAEADLRHCRQTAAQLGRREERARHSFGLLLQEFQAARSKLAVYETAFRRGLELASERPAALAALFREKFREEQTARRLAEQERGRLAKKLFLLRVDCSLQAAEKSRLVLANAALEVKGDAAFREREAALATWEQLAAEKEAELTAFVQRELPRLLSGLPVAELDRFLPGQLPAFPLPLPTAWSGQLSGAAGTASQQIFALAESLCLSKARQGRQELAVRELTERNLLYREKLAAAERVLLRWREKVEADLAATDLLRLPSPKSAAAPTTPAELLAELERRALLSAEREGRLLAELEKREAALLSREEEAIEWRHKCQLKAVQAEQLQLLVDHSLEADEAIKSKAVAQLSRLRLDLEAAHAAELRSLREFYEKEKNGLVVELLRLSATIAAPDGHEDGHGRYELLDGPDELHEAEQPPSPQRPAAESSAESILSSFSRGNPNDNNPRNPSSSRSNPNPSDSSLDLSARNGLFQQTLRQRDSPAAVVPTAQPQPVAVSIPSASSISSASAVRKEAAPAPIALPEGAEDKENRPNQPAGGDRSVQSASLPAKSVAAPISRADQATNTSASLAPPPPPPLHSEAVQTDAPAPARPSIEQQRPFLFEEEQRPRGKQTAAESVEAVVFQRIPRRLRERRSSAASSASSQSSGGLELPAFPPLAVLEDSAASASENQSLRAQIAAIERLDSSGPNDSQASASADLLLQLSAEQHQRALAAERRKAREWREEVRELEELLAVQHSYLHDLLARHPDNPSTANPNAPFAAEVRKEDAGLWPSAAALADELLTTLHTLLGRTREASAEQNLLRSAVAMANRIKALPAPAPAPASYNNNNPYPANPSNPGDFQLQSDEKLGRSLAALAQRMKLMEADLLAENPNPSNPSRQDNNPSSPNNVPERYLFLLRDLRYKVAELQETFGRELAEERDRWAREKAALSARLSQCQAALEELTAERQTAVEAVRTRYERSLQQAAESAESSTAVARQEIGRLEETVRRLSATLQQQQAVNADLLADRRFANPNPNPVPATLADNSNNNSNGLRTALEELERARTANRLLGQQLADEKNFMETNFGLLRAAYEKIIDGLESRLLSGGLGLPAPPAAEEERPADRFAALERRCQSLEGRCRLKSLELEAVLK
jgi:hypothetical protein